VGPTTSGGFPLFPLLSVPASRHPSRVQAALRSNVRKRLTQLENLSGLLPTIKARIKSTRWEADLRENIEANQINVHSSLESTPIVGRRLGSSLAKVGPVKLAQQFSTRPGQTSNQQRTQDSTSLGAFPVSTLTRSTRYFFRQGSSFSYQNGSHGVAGPASTRSQPQLVQSSLSSYRPHLRLRLPAEAI
jgi:hypothetical protein